MAILDFLKKNELQEIESLKKQLLHYQSIVDIEKEVERQKNEISNHVNQRRQEVIGLENNISDLSKKYADGKIIYDKLQKEVSIYQETLDLVEFGVYQTVYNFEKSEDYRNKQNKVIAEQKKMLKEDGAAICNTQWHLGNSEAKGRAAINKQKKLMLRAFNGECDALITKVKWNNITQIKERIHKSFEAINKLGADFHTYLSQRYLDLKIEELVLEYEYHVKKQQEKEQQKALNEEMREEERAMREYEREQKKAADEEAVYRKALEKARLEVGQVDGAKHDLLLSQISQLEKDLAEAQARKERAMSMAQQTKCGYVYVISNIGSFGEGVYKIGLTRRLDPMDRVRELGDASVPFQFDVHAMIYSEDAPNLEATLHRAFDDKKMNMMNYRKEFFRVSLDDVEVTIKKMGLDAELVRLSEAAEYRETLAINERKTGVNVKTEENKEFPKTIF